MSSLFAHLVLLLPLTAMAQPPDSRLAFEVASIKPSPDLKPGESRGTGTTSDGIRFGGATLRYCITFAYHLKDYQVSGPAWLADLRFDIVAKASEKARQNQFEEMLQRLLADRFNLRIHRETKEIPGYALVEGKGGFKLPESTEVDPLLSDISRPKSLLSPIPGVVTVRQLPNGGIRLIAGRAKISIVAANLANMLGAPVLDLTGAMGSYDFVLDASRDDIQNGMGAMMPSSRAPGSNEAAEPSGQSIFDSLQKLGLKLQSRKVPTEIIVVDHADKSPSEN